MIKLKKVKNGECYNCAIRKRAILSNMKLYLKLRALCDTMECAKGNFIYIEVN